MVPLNYRNGGCYLVNIVEKSGIEYSILISFLFV